MERQAKDSLIERFDAALDVIGTALRNCPDEQWGASLWWVDPRDLWVNDMWFWARDHDVSFWKTNWPAAAVAGARAMREGADVSTALVAMAAASGATLPEGVEPPPLQDEAAIQAISALWRVAFHALFHCDMRLSDPNEPFAPPPPFTPEDEDYGPRVLEREDLLAYVAHCRRKSAQTIGDLTPDRAQTVGHWNTTFERALEINVAHLEEHGAQVEREVAKWRRPSLPTV